MSGRRFALLAITGVGVAAAVGVGALWWMIGVPDGYAFTFLDHVAFVLAAVLGEQLVLPRPRGRATSMAIAVVGAAVLLGYSPAEAAGLAAAAWAAQTVVAVVAGRERRKASLPAGVITAWGLAGLMGVVTADNVIHFEFWHGGVSLVAVISLWLILVLGSPAVEAVEVALRADRGRRLGFHDLLRTSWQGDTVLAATASLGALAYPELGAPTVLLMALPLLAAKVGLERYTDIRRNYDQTLRAMSRLPEQLGAVDPGHGVRVGELAASTAVELGYGADVVADIERAAQLHELGRIRGEHGIELEPEEIANAGASIVTEAGGLDRVAELIAAHRGPVPVGNDLAWVGGALIRLACELDLRLATRPDGGLTAADEAWVYAQGVERRIAEGLIRSARAHYAGVLA